MNDNIKTMNSDSITTFKKAEKWTTATVPTATKKKNVGKIVRYVAAVPHHTAGNVY